MEEKRELKFLKFVFNFTIVWLFVLLFACFKCKIKLETVFDITILTSFCIVFLIDLASDAIFYWLQNKKEDKTKLSSDYIALNKKYKNDKYEFQNTKIDPKTQKINKNVKILMQLCKTRDSKFTFPIIYECDLHNKVIKFTDSQDMYELPPFISENASQLMQAHSTSTYYNSLTIRVKNWHTAGNIFILETGRTTYYKSLLTNRCMDFELQKNLTVRQVLEYRPYLSPLPESKLSNHLGFNAFVRTKDNYIPLILRKSDLTDGKKTYGLSVQASVKTKYALNANHEIREQDQLLYSMKKEIKDELGVPENEILNTEPYIYAAYRDIREGGKPQLFAFFNLSISKEQFEKTFYKHIQNKKNKDTSLFDGKKIVWLKADPAIESQIAISPKMIVYKKKKYLMTPSSAACVAFALEAGLLK